MSQLRDGRVRVSRRVGRPTRWSPWLVWGAIACSGLGGCAAIREVDDSDDTVDTVDPPSDPVVRENSLDGLTALIALMREAELMQNEAVFISAREAAFEQLPVLERRFGSAELSAEFSEFLKSRFAHMAHVTTAGRFRLTLLARLPPVYFVENLLSDAECGEAIALFNASMRESRTIRPVPAYRTSHSAHLNSSLEKPAGIRRVLRRMAALLGRMPVAVRAASFPVAEPVVPTELERDWLQFGRYTAGQYYRMHQAGDPPCCCPLTVRVPHCVGGAGCERSSVTPPRLPQTSHAAHRHRMVLPYPTLPYPTVHCIWLPLCVS